MLTEGACTQREATIVASVLAKVSVPVLHSAAALHRLCELAAEQMSSDPESAGPVNIFIKTLLDKKYALPYKVIDALVFHFLRFRAIAPGEADAMAVDGIAAGEKLPVIWHQCLLVFAQRYRNDITEDQREALLDLLLTRGHKSISPEIRRELLEGRGRGVVAEPPAVDLDGDDTMVMAVDA
jgi:essential nuclear protein 1